MFARFPAESLAQWTFQRDCTGTRILTGLPGDCCFGQDDEVRAAPVPFAGLLDHPVHKARELIETLPQSRVRAPKILDRGADDYLARQSESLAQWTFQRDCTGTRILTGLPGDCCFGQDGEVRAPPVPGAGLLQAFTIG